MEPEYGFSLGGGNMGVNIKNSVTKDVDEISTKVDKLQLEERLNEVKKVYSTANKKPTNTSKASSITKDITKDRQIPFYKKRRRWIPSIKKQQQDALRRKAAAAKRMQKLMLEFGTIYRQLTIHKWIWPFMQPVDVEGLGLHDYYQVIDKPMDLGTIKKQMEAKDGTGYKNVRDICADVRLVFRNAMKYNDHRSAVHVMAKTMLAGFEEKWLQLLPKVVEEEKRRKDEEFLAQLAMQLAQKVAEAKIARDLSNEEADGDAGSQQSSSCPERGEHI